MRVFKRLFVLPWLLSLAFVFIMQSCAIQGAGPIGGPKDTAAPRCILMEPENGTRNYQGKKIALNFNEFINVVNPYKQIIITPTLPANPEIISNRKRLVIDFGKIKLDSNTTYSIQFGKSIIDNNEGNPAKEIHYVFSTGAYIDSLQIGGRVIDALSQKQVDKVKVFLYRAGNDSSVLKLKPLYYSETTVDGGFRFTNLPKGKYTVFAVDDKNESMHLEDGESVGYNAELIQVDSNVKIKEALRLYHYENPLFQFKAIRITSIQGQIRLTGSIDSICFYSSGKRLSAYKVENDNRDSITIWPVSQRNLFKALKIVAWKNGKSIDTTINIILQAAQEKMVFARKDAIVSGENISKYGTPLAIRLQKPAYRIIAEKILVVKDTAKINGVGMYYLDSSHTVLGLRYKFSEGHNYRLIVSPGAFEDINGMANKDTMNIGVLVPAKAQFGYIEAIVKPKELAPYLFQLVDEKGIVVFNQAVSRETKVIISYVSPGNYRMRLIRDLNGNGRWDGGNFFTKTQPEPIYYYPELVNIRANWDVMDLVFDQSKLK